MEYHFFPLESAFWCIKLHVLKRNQKKLGMFHIFFHKWCHPVWVFPINWKPPRHQHAPTSLIRVQNLGLPINLEIHGDFMGSWGIQAHLLRWRGSKQASRPAFCRLYVDAAAYREGMAKACGKYRAAAMESKPKGGRSPFEAKNSNEFCQVATLQKLVSSRLVRSNEV